MRRLLLLCSTLLLLFSSVLWTTGNAELSVSAKSAVLMVADSCELLYEKAGRERRSMASTTKIMTALLACETDTPEKTVRIIDEMNKVEGTSMGLKSGDTVSLQALVTGAMLSSGNDAANAIALMMDGSLETFASRMNSRAAELGMTDTNFVTPSGLDAAEHYSSAYDMALLANAALKNQELAKICSSKNAKVTVGDRAVYLSNHNRLLREYEGCIGMKTGFTKKSGRCLVTAARRGGITLICVTLNAPSDWSDHKKLLDYGFGEIEKRAGENVKYNLNIVGGETTRLRLECPQTPLLPKNTAAERVALIRPFEYAPIKKGAVVGELRYYTNGKLLCSLPLIAGKEVNLKK